MLNPEQQKAVKTTEGPVRIIAGAGTGKTYTLIARIVYLVQEKKVDPTKILILTFTNKAAHEVADRLHKKNIYGIHATTFHSLAAKLLRQFWRTDFTIITQEEQGQILQEIIHQNEHIKEVILNLESVRNYNSKTTFANITENRFHEILHQYKKILAEKNAIDFTGLLEKLIEIWSKNPEILIKCQNLYQYIMVDEYQDVNRLQIKIMKNLAELHQNICIVGDPDQTIYSWRGARAETMTEFERLYNNVTSIALIKNYRNPPNILKGAEKLITHNIGRLKKQLKSIVENEASITLWENNTAIQQTETIFYLLEKYLGSIGSMHMADILDVDHDQNFKKFGDIAFLYRTQHEGKIIYEELLKRGYPCQISKADCFWTCPEITEFLDAIESLVQWSNIETDQKFSQWIMDKINKFTQSANLAINKINRLNHLVSYAIAFDHLPVAEALVQFLDEGKTEQEADNIIQTDKINLLTLHAAKGLEFPVVIISGLENGNIPSKKALESSYWTAEERRLLYVGMTRATEELHLLTCKRKANKIPLEPSRFLTEIGRDNLLLGQMSEVKIRQIKRREIKKSQMKLF